MDINELESFKLSDAVTFHKELNPKLWEDNKLDPEVRDQLLLIAEDFVEYLGISNLKVKDVTISGSNAAYSYTPHSDLDLHVLVDFNELPDNEVYQELFTAKKTLYNDLHDITVREVPVELYVQDTNQVHTSLGEYSVVHDKWIRIPKKRRANYDEAATKAKYEKLGDLIELSLKTKDPKRVKDTIDIVKRYRKAGLERAGEFGPENLAFKAIRKQGLIQDLYDLKAKLHTEKLSIEEENKVLNKPTLSVAELAKKHGVPVEVIKQQLVKGIKVELEHTSNKTIAREIALDHLAEDPNYYDKLASVKLEEYVDDIKSYRNPSPKTLYNLTKRSAHRHMRGMYHNGDTYWWDANDAIHADGSKLLGIPYDYLNRLEAAIDNVSGNYYVGGDDGVPVEITQRYDVEELAESSDITFTQEPYEGWNGMGAMITAYSDGDQVGQVIFEPTDSDKNKWYATEVEVEDDFQRRGIATTMYDMAKKIAQKANAVIVPSHAQTSDAKGFWKNKKIWEAPRTFQSQVSPLEKLVQDYGYLTTFGMAHLDKQGVTPEAQQQLLALVQRMSKDGKTFANLDKQKMEANRDIILNHIHQMMTYAIPVLKKNLPADKWEAKRSQVNAVLQAYNNARQINEASGYIPSEKEKNDPRFKTALTVDVKPDSIKKNAKAFGWKTSRAGIPPQANPSGKIAEDLMREFKSFLLEDKQPKVGYHVTATKNLPVIRKNGIKADRRGNSYVWDSLEMAEWFTDFQNDEGQDRTILKIDMAGIDARPDPEAEDMSEWSSRFKPGTNGGAWIVSGSIPPDKIIG